MHTTKACDAVDSVYDVLRETMEMADSQEIEVCVF
jgi:uncharacterized protein (DUF2267 family)